MPRRNISGLLLLLTVVPGLLFAHAGPAQHFKEVATVSNNSVLLHALTDQKPSLSQRRVFALQGNTVVQVTPENAAPILSQSRLTAEQLSGGPTKLALSGSLASLLRGKTQGIALPTQYTAINPNTASAVVFRVINPGHR